MKNTKVVYNVMQGCQAKGSSYIQLDLVKSFNDKAEAMKCFNSIKNDTKGWCDPIVITSLEEQTLEYDEDDDCWNPQEKDGFSTDECLEYFEVDTTK